MVSWSLSSSTLQNDGERGKRMQAYSPAMMRMRNLTRLSRPRNNLLLSAHLPLLLHLRALALGQDKDGEESRGKMHRSRRRKRMRRKRRTWKRAHYSRPLMSARRTLLSHLAHDHQSQALERAERCCSSILRLLRLLLANSSNSNGSSIRQLQPTCSRWASTPQHQGTRRRRQAQS